ncbi:MAG TPA: NAD(P)-dependent oxidoreductase [Rubrivivax sp.]|nr:NAD(P)-dependent oxidoreductase [Rubrivivax sp.]
MDVLIIEPLDADVLHWLSERHAVQLMPELAQDPQSFRRAIGRARAIVIPPSVALDAAALSRAPQLRIVGRLSVGAENIDLEACSRAGIEVVRPASASAVAEAEFVIGALLQMLRRVPILNSEGLLVGRELGGLTIGVVGVTPAVKHLSGLLLAFGAKVVGYDPGVHASDSIWSRSGVEPVSLRELVHTSDGVAVLLAFFPRYVGLFGDRLLSEAKADQVVVSLAHSSLFNEFALAHALTEGPLAAAWFDSMEPGAQDPGRPLRHLDTLQVTPRISGTTQQSRNRSAWAVARRIDELLLAPRTRGEFRPTLPGEIAGPEDDPA